VRIVIEKINNLPFLVHGVVLATGLLPGAKEHLVGV